MILLAYYQLLVHHCYYGTTVLFAIAAEAMSVLAVTAHCDFGNIYK